MTSVLDQKTPPPATLQKSQTPSREVEVAWKRLTESEAVRQQQSAFTCATSLPLTLLSASETIAELTKRPSGQLYCVQGCLGKHSGEICERLLVAAEKRAGKGATAVQFRCPVGLAKIIVPVTIGGVHAGNLVVGPFAVKALDESRLKTLASSLEKCGLGGSKRRVAASWAYTPVVSAEKAEAVSKLVCMFGDYLSEYGNRLLLQQASEISPLLSKIEKYLRENAGETVSLRNVAAQVHLSPCHFCRLFKKQTGLTFTEYRTRQRVEHAKRLLMNPHLRVTEAAFEAGFDSIPYFNRAFRRYVGCSPSEFRVRHHAN